MTAQKYLKFVSKRPGYGNTLNMKVFENCMSSLVDVK